MTYAWITLFILFVVHLNNSNCPHLKLYLFRQYSLFDLFRNAYRQGLRTHGSAQARPAPARIAVHAPAQVRGGREPGGRGRTHPDAPVGPVRERNVQELLVAARRQDWPRQRRRPPRGCPAAFGAWRLGGRWRGIRRGDPQLRGVRKLQDRVHIRQLRSHDSSPSSSVFEPKKIVFDSNSKRPDF